MADTTILVGPAPANAPHAPLVQQQAETPQQWADRLFQAWRASGNGTPYVGEGAR